MSPFLRDEGKVLDGKMLEQCTWLQDKEKDLPRDFHSTVFGVQRPMLMPGIALSSRMRVRPVTCFSPLP